MCIIAEHIEWVGFTLETRNSILFVSLLDYTLDLLIWYAFSETSLESTVIVAKKGINLVLSRHV